MYSTTDVDVAIEPFCETFTCSPTMGTPLADHEEIPFGPKTNGRGSMVRMVGVLNDSLTLRVRVRVAADERELEMDSETYGLVKEIGSDAVAECDTDFSADEVRDIELVIVGYRVVVSDGLNSRERDAVFDAELVADSDCVALTVCVGVATSVGVNVATRERVCEGVGNVFVRRVTET